MSPLLQVREGDSVFAHSKHVAGTVFRSDPPNSPTRSSATHSSRPASANEHPPTAPGADVFIKSFVFGPDLPIRIDYEGKRFSMEELVGRCVDRMFSIMFPGVLR